jgi:hypothetical protein
MADAKITELTELTAVDPSDLLAIVDDPSGTPVTKKATVNNIADSIAADSNTPVMNSSMARQAIINGNFDVWQRGTTSTNPVTATFLADRWNVSFNADSGTPPTNIVHTRQALTAGDIANAFYHYRIAPDGAGSSYGANSHYTLRQKIEFGTRFLCGLNKTVTVSFYARSSITNKKLGILAIQHYGTGGSPSTLEYINGENWTLTSSWTKYTHTFTTNTLASKTFGTANDDSLYIDFAVQWGSTRDAYYGADGAEDFVGSGTIDIAQVQLCAGDVALPFMPKSYEEELRACQRYYQKSYLYETAVGTNTQVGAFHQYIGDATTATLATTVYYPVEIRTASTPVIYDFAGTSGKVYKGAAGKTGTVTNLTTKTFYCYTTDSTSAVEWGFHWVVDSEL